MFTNLTELTFLGIAFHDQKVGNISYFSNAFDTLSKVESLYFYGFNNPITSYAM